MAPPWARAGWRGPRLPLAAVGARLERRLAVSSACGAWRVRDVSEGDRWGPSPEGLVAPRARHGARAGGLIGRAASVPQRGERGRSARPRGGRAGAPGQSPP